MAVLKVVPSEQSVYNCPARRQFSIHSPSRPNNIAIWLTPTQVAITVNQLVHGLNSNGCHCEQRTRTQSVLNEVDETPISDIHIHTDLLIIFIT